MGVGEQEQFNRWWRKNPSWRETIAGWLWLTTLLEWLSNEVAPIGLLLFTLVVYLYSLWTYACARWRYKDRSTYCDRNTIRWRR